MLGVGLTSVTFFLGEVKTKNEKRIVTPAGGGVEVRASARICWVVKREPFFL